MKNTLYIFSNGRLKRKENTIYFETEDGKRKFVPVENTKEIFIFGEVDLNTKMLNFLSQKEIILHYFNYYGYYSGSFYPREHYNSGYMILKQAKAYMDPVKRLYLAKMFIRGAAENALKTMKYYLNRGKDLRWHIEETEKLIKMLEKQSSIDKAMAIEGNLKQKYYDSFNLIINKEDFSFVKRKKHPPKDQINAMISFANSLIYTYVLSEIYQTHLDPRIGFLHSTNFRRFTLNLDVAEIFKPIIGDRTIFALLNKSEISKKDFEKKLNGIVLNEKGKRKFLEKIEDKLKQTIKHPTLKKNVSYRRLIRLELYKIEKDLMGEKEYEPFVMQW